MRRPLIVVVLGSALSFGACSSSTTNEGPGSGGASTGGSSAGGSSTGGASTGGSSTGGSSTGGSSTGGASTGGSGGTAADGGMLCPAGKQGPALVAVGSKFCIDATEVTNADYQMFLGDLADAGSQNLTGLSACKDLVDYSPSNGAGCPSFGSGVDLKFPVRCVDWCSAYAYCKWAGKRLCGKVGGGAAGQPSDAMNQWYSACSGSGAADDYFYGPSPESGRCVDALPVVAVGSKLGGDSPCESYWYPGLTDMVGNVAEWEDACAVPQSADSDCATRGGSASQGATAAICTTSKPVQRSSRLPDLGFRCCWDSSVDQ